MQFCLAKLRWQNCLGVPIQWAPAALESRAWGAPKPLRIQTCGTERIGPTAFVRTTDHHKSWTFLELLSLGMDCPLEQATISSPEKLTFPIAMDPLP